MSRPTAPEPPRAQSTLPRPTSGNDDAAMERFFSLLGRIPPESLEEELEEDQARNMLKSVGFSDKRIEHAIRYCRLTSDDHFGSVTLPDLLRRIGQPRLAHIAAGSFARTQTETELEYKKRSIAERYRLRGKWSKSDAGLSESLDAAGGTSTSSDTVPDANFSASGHLCVSSAGPTRTASEPNTSAIGWRSPTPRGAATAAFGRIASAPTPRPGAPAEAVKDWVEEESEMLLQSIPQRRMILGGGTPKPGKIVKETTFSDECLYDDASRDFAAGDIAKNQPGTDWENKKGSSGQPPLPDIAASRLARTQSETDLETKKRSIAERYRLRSDWSKSDSDLSERSLDMSGPGAPAEPVDDCQRKASGMPLHSMTNSIPQRRMHLGGGTPKPGKIVEVTTFADEHHGGRTSRGRKHVQQAWAEPLVDQNKLVQDIILKGFSERAARIVADYQSKPKPQANAPRGLDPDNPLPTSVRRRFMVSENDDFCYTGQAGTKADMPLRASTRGTPLAGGSWKVATTSPTSADASGSECCKEPKPPPTPKPGKLFKAIGAALGSFSKASAGMGTGSRTGSRRT